MVVNWASTWANQTSGSVGQKDGSFMLTAARVGVGQEQSSLSSSRELCSTNVRGHHHDYMNDGNELSI